MNWFFLRASQQFSSSCGSFKQFLSLSSTFHCHLGRIKHQETQRGRSLVLNTWLCFCLYYCRCRKKLWITWYFVILYEGKEKLWYAICNLSTGWQNRHNVRNCVESYLFFRASPSPSELALCFPQCQCLCKSHNWAFKAIAAPSLWPPSKCQRHTWWGIQKATLTWVPWWMGPTRLWWCCHLPSGTILRAGQAMWKDPEARLRRLQVRGGWHGPVTHGPGTQLASVIQKHTEYEGFLKTSCFIGIG